MTKISGKRHSFELVGNLKNLRVFYVSFQREVEIFRLGVRKKFAKLRRDAIM